MASPEQRIHDPVVQKHPRLHPKLVPHFVIHVVDPKPSVGVRVHPDQNLELLLAGRPPLRDHHFRELVRRAELVAAVQAVGEGIEGGEIVMVPFLAVRPVEELGGQSVVCLNL